MSEEQQWHFWTDRDQGTRAVPADPHGPKAPGRSGPGRRCARPWRP
ncbi:hypothetical protein NKH77_10505 [Streptomyces sp. M19]